MTTDRKLYKGICVQVLEGDTHAHKMFTLTTDDPIDVGTSDITFVQYVPWLAATSDGAPSTTPDYIGQFCIDTTNKNAYVSCGATSGDWKIIT